MKKIIISLLLLCGYLTSNAQTTIVIIGTEHEESSYFNADTLFNIMERIKPDVILIELDSIFFTSDFNFDFVNDPDILCTNENIAAYNYQQRYGIDLRPYEITGRNEYYRQTDYFKKEQQMFNDILELYNNDQFSKIDREDFELILFALPLNQLKYESIKDHNTDISMSLDALRQKVMYSKMVSIVENTESLRHWAEFANTFWSGFWDRRNAAMASNIEAMSKRYHNKTMVVLTGWEHKHYLNKLLKPRQEESNFTLREYWTY